MAELEEDRVLREAELRARAPWGARGAATHGASVDRHGRVLRRRGARAPLSVRARTWLAELLRLGAPALRLPARDLHHGAANRGVAQPFAAGSARRPGRARSHLRLWHAPDVVRSDHGDRAAGWAGSADRRALVPAWRVRRGIGEWHRARIDGSGLGHLARGLREATRQ